MKNLYNILHRLRALAVAFVALCAFAFRTPLANDGALTVGTHQDGLMTGFHDNAPQTTRYLLVKQGSADNYYATPTATNDMPLGVCADEPAAITDPVNIIRLNSAGGTIRMVAAGAIAAGAIVITNGDGKVKAAPSTPGTYWQVGVACTTAVNSGDLVEVDAALQQVRINTAS